MNEHATWVKIKRAEKHIRELKGEVDTFLKRDPYTSVGKDDPQTGERVWRVRVREEPETSLWLGAIAGDAIHNLRSCLDLLACQLVLAGNGTVTTKTRFPVYRSAKDFKASALPEIEGAGKVAMELVRDIEPYKGGNKLLYDLHRLDINQKHRDLIPVGATITKRVLRMRNGATFTNSDIRMVCPLEEDTELLRFPSDFRLEMDTDPQFTFHVAFDEGEVVKGQAIVPALHQFVGLVQEIIFVTFADLLS